MESANRLSLSNDHVRDTKRAVPLGADLSNQLGWFRFYFDDDRWAWSPQVERMHGYQPATTAPSTILLLSHVHLDDYQRVAALLHGLRATPRPFNSRHRLVDTGHRLHDLLMVGTPFHDADGEVLGVRGFCVDVTALSDLDRDDHRQDIRAVTRC